MKTVGFVLLITSIIILQLYFSKKDSKGLGWILPSAVFLFSLDRMYSFFINITARYPEYVVLSEIIRFLITIFIVINTLTFILILINVHFKKKRRAMKELEKMNIRDLG